MIGQAHESLGITKGGTGGCVVEDAPDLLCLLLRNRGGEALQVGLRISRVVAARAAVKATVEELVPSTGRGGCGDSRWVRRNG
jgi:hypothetical protein